MQEYYVTIQLTNGKIESIIIPMEEKYGINDVTIQQKLEEWTDIHFNYDLKYMYIKGHIISWSKIIK